MKKLVSVVAMFMFVCGSSTWLRILLRLSPQLNKPKAQRIQQLLNLQRMNRKQKSRNLMNRLRTLRPKTSLKQKLLLSLPNNSKHTKHKKSSLLVYSRDDFFVLQIFSPIRFPSRNKYVSCRPFKGAITRPSVFAPIRKAIKIIRL